MTTRKVEQTYVYTIEDSGEHVIIVLPDGLHAPDLLRPEDFDIEPGDLSPWLFDIEATAVIRRHLIPKA